MEDTLRAELTWRAGPAQMRRSTQGNMAEPSKPTQCAGANRCRRCMAGTTRVHADARVAPRGRGAGKWRVHRLVGPGNRIGAVTQRL